jgi:hypothetical protein
LKRCGTICPPGSELLSINNASNSRTSVQTRNPVIPAPFSAFAARLKQSWFVAVAWSVGGKASVTFVCTLFHRGFCCQNAFPVDSTIVVFFLHRKKTEENGRKKYHTPLSCSAGSLSVE